MDTESFIVYVKMEDVFKGLAGDVEKRFDTSNYKLKRPLPIDKNKVIGRMKDELKRKITKNIVVLSHKMYSHLNDESLVDEKPNGTRK